MSNLMDNGESLYQQAFIQYQSNFNQSKSLEASAIVSLGETYEKLKFLLNNSIQSKTSLSILLFGLQGYGRKTAVRYAIQQIQSNPKGIQDKNIHAKPKSKKQKNFILIEMDAMLHNSELIFVQALVAKLKYILRNSFLDIDVESADFRESLNFQKLNQEIKKISQCLILSIDNIHELTTIKRQALLYSLLEWIKQHDPNIILIGITSNILFTQELEKRVASRLQTVSLQFFSFPFQGLLEIIKKRVTLQGSTYMNTVVSNLLTTGLLNSKLEHLHSLQKPIEWFMRFFETLFATVEIKRLPDISSSQNQSMEQATQQWLPFFADAFDYTVELMCPHTGKALIRTLAEPESLIIFILARMIKEHKQEIAFSDITADLSTFRKRNQMSQMNKGTVYNFSNEVLFKAFDNLLSLHLVKLSQSKNNFNNNQQQSFGGDNKNCNVQQLILCVELEDIDSLLLEKRDFLPPVIYSYLQ